MLNTLSIPVTLETNERVLLPLLVCFSLGCLLPLGFAPFHLPGLSILGLMCFYAQLVGTKKAAFFKGLAFGCGYFGLGVSWVYVSIHAYGHLHPLLAGLITILFILYLALYTACMGLVYQYAMPKQLLAKSLLFASLWTVFEYLRSYLFTGFPWLLIGISQFDTPLKGFIPVLGVYGTSFITCFIATAFQHALQSSWHRRISWLTLAITLIFFPLLWTSYPFTKTLPQPLEVSVIQANLSMRDKWDETLFWSLIRYYDKHIEPLLEQDLIILPESAIPIPAQYIHDFLVDISEKATAHKTAILLGIPLFKHAQYYNGLIGLGLAHGKYAKQHLVPFGEYIPQIFRPLMTLLKIDDPQLTPGAAQQPLIEVKQVPIASLICYELAYAQLLRAQLPEAAFIVSISDDGWFGRSLALYQQLQIAQVRSLQTGRYQIVSNNDGLSAILNTQGEIVESLPAFSAGTLSGTIYPAVGQTPWVRWGEVPVLILLLGSISYLVLHKRFNSLTK